MNRLRAILAGLLLLSLAAAPVNAQQGTEPITVTDLLKLKQLDDVAVSPDGRFVAYTVRSAIEKPEAEGEYTYRSHLWLLPVAAGGQPQQMTFDDRTVSQPNWHPDSDRLVFVRPVDGKPQLFVLPIYGGEAQQLTDFEHGASGPQWSPDGKRLLFSASLTQRELAEMTDTTPVWSDERPGRTRGDGGTAEPDPDGSLAEVRAWLDASAEDGNPRVFNRLDLQDELDLATAPDFRHYFVLDLSPEDTQDDAEPRLLTSGYQSFSDAVWLPDSRQILLSSVPSYTRPTETPHPDRERDRDIYLLDTLDDQLRLLLSIEGYALSTPLLAPDGNTISFLARDIDDPGYAQTELGLFNLDGRTPPELLTLDFDRSLGSPAWAFNNWFIYFVAPSEGGFPLYRVSILQNERARRDEPEAMPDDTLAADSLGVPRARAHFARGEVTIRTPEVERLTSQEQGIRDYDITAASAYYVLTEPANPYELYGSNMEFRQQQRLTEHNASWLATKRLSVPEPRTLRQDTLDIQYWVMQPTFFERGQTYPMLLEIHGGPSAMWGPGEASMWHEFQLMAAKGYGVVFSNPRGSGGYGYDFKRANYQDWGDGPAGDVLAVATDAVRRYRWIDEDRQVVTGGSYAGYLTAWIVGHDKRFKAAVAQRGVYDLSTFFGEGNAWRLVPSHFGGYPWEDEAREVLAYNSPLTYVEEITTPLLIIHGDNDLRTGVIQSEVLYKSLKALERPVEYVRYPNAGHDLSRSGDPKQRMDRLLRIYEFMERYVGPTQAPMSSQ